MKKVIILFLILLTVFLPANKILAADKVEINTATLAQLDELTGVGPAIGQRIIDARPFSSVDDLLKVKGIGDKILQKIKDQGLAYVDGQAQPTTGPIEPAKDPNPPKIQPAPEPPPTQTQIEKPVEIYPEGVFINEILPAPEGADDQNEYIEIYNSNTTNVDLSGWKLQDAQGTGTTYVFPEKTSILADNYIVLKRPQTNITLNNDEDGLSFIQPNGKVIDSISFSKAPKNQSYNKMDSGWQWSINQTPGTKNTITTAVKPVVVVKKSTNVLPNTEKTDSKYLSALSESVNTPAPIDVNSLDSETTGNPWLLFWGALAAIIILALGILALKLNIFKKTNIQT